jgi:hypothetical protein
MQTIAVRRHSDAWGTILLVLLPLGGLESVYRLTNFLCMAKAEPAFAHLWMARIWMWLLVSLLLGISWIVLLLMLVRHGRQGK